MTTKSKSLPRVPLANPLDPVGAAREALQDSLALTLLMAARNNELRIAYVRMAALALTAALDTVAFLNPMAAMGVTVFPAANALLATAWFFGAVVLAAALHRGWYHPVLRTAIPACDGLMVASLFVTVLTSLADAPRAVVLGGLVNVAAVCALFAVSGALRLTASAAATTAVLSVVTFTLSGWLAGLRVTEIAFVCSILVATGLLGYWMAAIVRRSVESEVARVVLERFLPQRVVRDAHEDPLALISTPRSLEATVLVSDLRGFTAYAEGRSPVEVLGFLNRLQGAVAAVVLEHGGTVDKFMGDGMLAVFGAPEPLADDAGQAIRAAAEMVRAVERMAREAGASVRIGIGVHRGSLVAGCLGAGLRLEFTVIGDAVNTASRLESETKAAGVTVLVSAAVLDVARGTLPALRPVGRLELRGRSAAIEAYTLADG